MNNRLHTIIDDDGICVKDWTVDGKLVNRYHNPPSQKRKCGECGAKVQNFMEYRNGTVKKNNNNEYENWTSLWSERGELCFFYKDTDKDRKNPTIYFIHDDDVRDKINSKGVVSTDDVLKLINDSHDYYTKEIRVLVRIVSDKAKI